MARWPPVASELIGCWRRDWIRFADGACDDTTTVYWLQHGSAMVDVRVPATQPAAAGRTRFAEFTIEELVLLADSEASSGRTTCTPIEVAADGVLRATAEWFTRDDGDDGHGDVAFQPVTAFPEPGWLEWGSGEGAADDAADDAVMIERAPSGAYVEQWRRVPGSQSPVVDVVLPDGSRWLRTGPVAAIVRDRAVPVPRLARLRTLVAECHGDRARIEMLLDCEFSIAVFDEHADGASWRVAVSTLPWRVGARLDDPAVAVEESRR